MKNVHNLLISFFRKNLEGKFYAFTCHWDSVQIVLLSNFNNFEYECERQWCNESFC